jgi:iron complex outermembrane recepter protein
MLSKPEAQRMITTGKTAFSMALLLAAMAGSSSVQAETRAPSITLEEVVVTARKRSENLQDIPESITAFSSVEINNAGITRVKDVADLVPNLILQPSYRMGVINLSARGLATPQQGNSPVVLNIDGVQAPAQDFMNQDLFDIERIEVLKGPQGALYGAGAIGGAINIVTKEATNEFEAFVKAKLANENAQRFVGGVSGPLVEDKLFYRISGVYLNEDGYIENVTVGDDADFIEETALRVNLLADLGDLRIDFRASRTDTEAGASFYESFPLLSDPVPEIDNIFGGPLGRFGSNISDPEHVTYSNVPVAEERDVTSVSIKVDYDIASGTFTSITGYNESNQADFGDLDFQPIDFLLQDVRFDVEVVNQEFRFASDDSAAFRWVAGTFLQAREIYNQVLVLVGSPSSNFLLTDTRDGIETDAWGVFFSSNYDLTDSLVLTAAVRYDKVKLDAAYVGEDAAVLALPLADASETYDEWQPKLNLAYNVSESVMVYVDLARGFRAGEANTGTAYRDGLPRFIEPEVADTVEFGFKSTFFDRRLSFNGAVFQNDIENRHHYFYGASLQSMTTYDEATVVGIELDMMAMLTEGLTLSLSAGYMEPEITSDELTAYRAFTPADVANFLPSSGPVALVVSNEGNVLPDTPERTINAALSYERPFTGQVMLYTRLGYKYTSKLYFDTENLIDNGGSTQIIDYRLGLQADNWALMGFVNNLTDERTYSNYAYSGAQGNYLPNKPRIYGIEFSYDF